jgi:hypothetical protein
MGLALWQRGDSLVSLGFGFPPNWVQTILLGLVLGAFIQLISVTLLEPFAEKVTGIPHDHSILSNVKGNWKAFFQWMLVVWVGRIIRRRHLPGLSDDGDSHDHWYCSLGYSHQHRCFFDSLWAFARLSRPQQYCEYRNNWCFAKQNICLEWV